MKNEPPHELPSFDVDAMLGRLAKWLRILGFDTEYPRSAPSEGRHFVTTRAMAARTGVVRYFGAAPGTAQEVMAQTGISMDLERMFTRCLVCNLLVVEVTREHVEGRVPEEFSPANPSSTSVPAVCGSTGKVLILRG